MGEIPLLVPIAEGDGDQAALPVLLPRLCASMGLAARFSRTYNAHGRTNLVKPGGVERFVRLASLEPGCAGVLILLDAEGSCGVELARRLAARVVGTGSRPSVAIVTAVAAFEAWFLASLTTIVGKKLKGVPGLPALSPEEVPNPKAWIDRHLPSGRRYREREDQPAMTELIDLRAAERGCRSFRRLMHALVELVEAADVGRVITPAG